MAKLLLFNKPYGVLCQFTSNDDRPTLAQFIKVPKVYAAGRLDQDSEGLLLLTDDGVLQHRLSHPKNKAWKHYWVQVEGEPSSDAIQQLCRGVILKDGLTLPAKVRAIAPPAIWERDPPVRFRKHIPTTWLDISLREGRNRQVRRMTAAVGFPTLRLVRHRIGDWSLADLRPGEYRVEAVDVPGSNVPGSNVLGGNAPGHA